MWKDKFSTTESHLNHPPPLFSPLPSPFLPAFSLHSSPLLDPFPSSPPPPPESGSQYVAQTGLKCRSLCLSLLNVCNTAQLDCVGAHMRTSVDGGQRSTLGSSSAVLQLIISLLNSPTHCVRARACVCGGWGGSEENLWETDLSFHHGGLLSDLLPSTLTSCCPIQPALCLNFFFFFLKQILLDWLAGEPQGPLLPHLCPSPVLRLQTGAAKCFIHRFWVPNSGVGALCSKHFPK